MLLSSYVIPTLIIACLLNAYTLPELSRFKLKPSYFCNLTKERSVETNEAGSTTNLSLNQLHVYTCTHYHQKYISTCSMHIKRKQYLPMAIVYHIISLNSPEMFADTHEIYVHTHPLQNLAIYIESHQQILI